MIIAKRKKRTNWNAIISILPLAIFTIVFVAIPLAYLVVISFLARTEGIGISNEFTLKNYRDMLEPVYLKTFWTSLKLAFLSTGIVIALGYPFGYFMAKLSGKWKARIMSLLMLPFWVNSLLRLNGWKIFFRSNGPLDKILMTFKLTKEPLGLLYSYPIVVFGMVYALLPFMIFSVYSSAEKMDWTLVEASRDLGATPFRAFLTITLKLTMPGLLSGVVLTFIPSMGLFFIADILGGNKIVLVGNLINDQNNVAHNTPLAAALAVVLMILTSIIIAMYKKIANVKGLEGLV